MSSDPFAAPGTARTRRLPDIAWWTPLAMGSAFAVGGMQVEVETSHWTGLEIYRIDGVEVARARNLGWHASQTLDVGGRTVRIESRWYPLLPVVVTVDGDPWLDQLFPQLSWLFLTLTMLTVLGIAALGALLV